MSESDHGHDASPAPHRGHEVESSVEQSPSKADVFMETGLTPSDYIRTAIERAGGKLKQQAVCSFTGWSEPTVSRTLTEMERAGAVVRVQFGTEKIVYLPEDAPDGSSLPTGTR